MKNQRKKIVFVSAIMMGCLYGNPQSWATSSVPSSADPSRTLTQPDGYKTPQFKNAEPDKRPKAVSVPNAPQGSDTAFFILQSIRFDGMTAYSIQEIQEIYRKDIGQKISVARLFEIMNLVQRRYLDDGYSLSRVLMPTQDISNGQVSLQVIEGYAAEVEMDAGLPNHPALEEAAQRISAMRPLNTKTLERILLILNDLPALNVSAVLGAAQGTPSQIGGIKLILKGNPEKSRSISLGVNNHGSLYSGPFQSNISIQQANIFGYYDEIAATFSAAIPMSEMHYLRFKYQKPIFGASGTTLLFDTSIGRTNAGANLASLDIQGRSQSFKTELSYPLIRQRDETLRLNTSAELRTSKTDLLATSLYTDKLRIFNIGTTYNNADSYDGLNVAEVTYSQGFDILGAGQGAFSRIQGRPDFKKIYASFGRLQGLPDKYNVLFSLQGQYAFGPLFASEEFGFGGGQMGRGYDPSEITGDRGIAATFELRKNLEIKGLNAALQPYGFFDFGKVWNIDPSSKNQVSAASSGVGLRTGLSSGWSADINFSTPLTKKADKPPQYANGKASRILLSIQKNF